MEHVLPVAASLVYVLAIANVLLVGIATVANRIEEFGRYGCGVIHRGHVDLK